MSNLATILKPRGALLLNVQIDQLNRFFEPARVVGMLRSIADTASEFVVVNADDDSLRGVGAELAAQGRDVTAFGVAPSLIAASPNGLANVEDFAGGAVGGSAESALPASRVIVAALDARTARLDVDASPVEVALPARGLHYAVDAAGATATALRVLGDRFSADATARAMTALRTVYGRGETLRVGDEDVEIIMMKNPPSLQLNLDYLAEPPEQVFVAVDEGTPDPSWVYDIDLSSITHVDVVSGTKAWQFATRFALRRDPGDLGPARAPSSAQGLPRSAEADPRHEDDDRQLRADDAHPQAARIPRVGGQPVTAPLRILHLYPRELGINGDVGNVTALVKRAEWRGLEATVHHHDVGDELVDGGRHHAHRQRPAVVAAHRPRGRAADRGRPSRACGMPVSRSWPIAGGWQLLGHQLVTSRRRDACRRRSLPVARDTRH